MAEEKEAPRIAFRQVCRVEQFAAAFPQREERATSPRRLAVLFPGFGYSCDKPLLHYARRAAEQAGCGVLPVLYPDALPVWDKQALARSVADCLPPALAAARGAVLAAREKYHGTELLFFSKSFGTVVAGALSAQLQYRGVRNFYLTPLLQTLPYMEAAPCAAAAGTADPYLPDGARRKMAALPTVELHLCPGANHSLEVPGDAAASVQVLRSLVESYLYFLGDS